MKTILLQMICTLLVAGYSIQYNHVYAETHENENVTGSINNEENEPGEIEEYGDDQLIEPVEPEENEPGEIEEYGEDQLFEPDESEEDEPREIERY
jgi:hypothetical protein